MRLVHPSRLVAIGLAAALAMAGSGCGGDPGGGSGPTATAERPAETADALAKLQPGWRYETSRAGGYAIAVPPLWGAGIDGSQMTIRAPRSAVVVSISADRSNEALDAPLGDFAGAFARGLAGEFERVRVSDPRRVASYYAARTVQVTARNAETGTRQRIDVIVIRRDQLSAFPLLIARNLGTPARLYREELVRMVSSLRGLPVEAAG